MANTIDLRGNEQVATRKQAEQYAAYAGYEYVLWLSDGFDVDPNEADNFEEDNPWYQNEFTYCDVCAEWYPNDDRCKFH